MSAKHAHSYTITVAADTPAEAMEIAAEGLPRGATLLDDSTAVPSSSDGCWDVTLRYKGGRRTVNNPAD